MEGIQIKKLADLEKVNRLEKEGVETISALDNKRQYLMDELSELMDEASGDYGPFIMAELQRRLEFVVQNFNSDLEYLIQSSFEEWKINDSQLRDLMSNNIGNLDAPKQRSGKEKYKDKSTPTFIKDVKFGPIRRR